MESIYYINRMNVTSEIYTSAFIMQTEKHMSISDTIKTR